MTTQQDAQRPRCSACRQPMTSAASIERGHCWRCHYTPAPASPTAADENHCPGCARMHDISPCYPGCGDHHAR